MCRPATVAVKEEPPPKKNVTSRHDAFSITLIPPPPSPPSPPPPPLPPARVPIPSFIAAAPSWASSGSPQNTTKSTPCCTSKGGNAGANVRSPQARTKWPGLRNVCGGTGMTVVASATAAAMKGHRGKARQISGGGQWRRLARRRAYSFRNRPHAKQCMLVRTLEP